MAFRSSLGSSPGTASRRSARTGRTYSSVSSRKSATATRRATGYEPTPEEVDAGVTTETVQAAQAQAPTPTRYEQAQLASGYYAARGEGVQASRARTRALFLEGTGPARTQVAYQETPVGTSRIKEEKVLRSQRTALTPEAKRKWETEKMAIAAAGIEQAVYGQKQKTIQFETEKQQTSFFGLYAGVEKAEKQVIKKEEERLAKREKVTRSEELRELKFATKDIEKQIKAKKQIVYSTSRDVSIKQRYDASKEVRSLSVQSAKNYFGIVGLGIREHFAPGAFTPKDKAGKPMMIETVGGQKLPYTLQQTLAAREKTFKTPGTIGPVYTAKEGEVAKYDVAFEAQSGFTRPEAEKITRRAGVTTAAGVVVLGTGGVVLPAVIGTTATGIGLSGAVGATVLGSRAYTSVKTGTPLSVELKAGVLEWGLFEAGVRGPGAVKTYSPVRYTKITHPTAVGGTRSYRGISVGEKTLLGVYKGKPIRGSPAKQIVAGVKQEGPGVSADFFRLETPAKAKIGREILTELGRKTDIVRQQKIEKVAKPLQDIQQDPSGIEMLPKETRTSTPTETKEILSFQQREKGAGFGSYPQAAEVGYKTFKETRMEFLDIPKSKAGVGDLDVNIPRGEIVTQSRTGRFVKTKLRPAQEIEGLGRKSYVEPDSTAIKIDIPGQQKGQMQADVKSLQSPDVAPETYLGITIEKKPIKIAGETTKGVELLKESPLSQQILAKAETISQFHIQKGEIKFGPPPGKEKGIGDFFSATRQGAKELPKGSAERIAIEKELADLKQLYPKQKVTAPERAEIPYSVSRRGRPSLAAASVSPVVSPSVSRSVSVKSPVSKSPSKSISKSIVSPRSVSPSPSKSYSIRSPPSSSLRSISYKSPPSPSSRSPPSPGRARPPPGGGFFGKMPGFTIPKERARIKPAKAVKYKTKYMPSVEALVFKIKGKRSKKGRVETGLSLRPIIG